jgi:hypothetical protein
LSVWVIVVALAVKVLLALVVVLVIGIVAYSLWCLYRQHRQEKAPRLIFKQ